MEKAVAHCEDCKENLCETCYQAHIRVRITKEHRITWLHGKNPLLNSGKKTYVIALLKTKSRETSMNFLLLATLSRKKNHS